MGYCAGVDIGGTTVKIGFFTETGRLLKKWEIPTDTQGRREKLYGDIASSIREQMAGCQLEMPDLLGVGVGIPGPVLPDGSVPSVVNLGLYNLNIDKELPDYLDGVRVHAVNDANSAALGEQWQGSGKDCDSMVMLTLGTGVGSGIIQNGKLITGSFGMAGELGHITVNPDETEICNCGGHGCMEQYASATGVVHVAEKFLAAEDVPSIMREISPLTAKDVFDAAKAGDVLAQKAVEKSMYYLGMVMAFVSHVTDPQCFVIGGGVSKAGQYLLDVLRPQYEKFVSIQKPQADIRLASLGNDAGIYGAARVILG